VVGRAESVVILAQREDRVRNLVVLGTLVVWMVYTRVFWGLYAAHATLPPCPFFRLTGHPCPFCGGTRSFAYMWRGDIAHAIQIYPLGVGAVALAISWALKLTMLPN
jgi:uncharacterized protein DUF2752